MSDAGDGLRALALTAMLVVGAFAGTVAFSGAVAGAANETPEVVQSVEYDGTIEVTFSDGVVQNNTVDPSGTSGTGDQLNERNFTVVVDGVSYGADDDFDVQYSSGTKNNGEDVTFTLDPQNSWGDLKPYEDVTLRIDAVQTDVAGGPVVKNVEEEVVTTSQTITSAGGYDTKASAATVFKGETIALQGSQGESLSVRRVGGSIVFSSEFGNSSVRSVDTSLSGYNTGETYVAEFGSGTVQYFNVTDLDLTATATDTNIDDGTDLTVETSTLRRGGVLARLYDADGNEVASQSLYLTGGVTTTVDFGPQSTSGSPYSVSVRDNETGITTTTSDITVEDEQAGSVSFNKTVYEDQRGDVVAFGLQFTDNDVATVTIGTTGENNWAQNVTVKDGNGDGFVALEFNTYTAGTSDNTDASRSPYVVYSVADSGDSVTNVAPASGAFDPSGPAEDTLGVDNYGVTAVTGPDPASETRLGADSVATLGLNSRSTDALTTYVAPDRKRGDIDSLGAIESLIANDNVTQASEVADKDIVLLNISTNGLEGVLANWTSGSTPAVDSPTDAFFAEAWSDNPAWEFWVNQTNPGTNSLAYNATLNASNTELVLDANDDEYWLVVDTDLVTDFSNGDELEANFTTRDEDDVNDDDTTVLDSWTFADPEATVDKNADIDDDGSVDEVLVQKATGQQITGTANVAPGTELTLRITGTDSGSPFVKPLTTVVQPDGSWTATADFSDNAQGANFTINVKRGNKQIVQKKVDGRIAAAPSASVTFNDQESSGSSVTVDSVTLSDGGFVAVHLNNASGKIVGTSTYIEAGSDSDVNIDLNQSLTEDTTLVAMPHLDTDGDQTFEFEFGSSLDAPYIENGSAVTDSASITVTAPNDNPTATDDSYSVVADETLSEFAPGVLENDDDPNGDSLSVTTTPVSGPADGSLTLNADGSFTYTPASDFTGTDSFTYEVTDGEGGTDTAKVSIDVTESNTAPTASDDSYTVDAGGTLSASAPGVLENDDDPEGDPLSASIDTRPSNGVLTLDSDGSFVYAPESGFSGTDSFTYRASDGTNADTATVTIEVESADTPSDGSVTLSCVGTGGGARYEADSGLTVYENDTAVTYGNFGADGESITFQGGAIRFESPGNAQARLEEGTGSRVCLGDVRANGSAPLTVAPDGDVSSVVFTDGAVQFAYRDPVYDTADDSVDLAYEAVSPLSLTVGATGLSEGTTVAAKDAETGGTLASGTVDADGALALELPAGTERVDLRTVTAVTASDDDYSVVTDETLSVAANEGLLANDAGGDGSLSVETTPVSGPADGSLTLNADGSFTYTPASGFSGTDSFTYRVTDGTQTDTATVTVDVTATNDPPVAATDSYGVDENGTLSVSAPGVLGNDDDPDGDTLTASVVDRPSNGVVTLTDDGSFLYAPASGFTGTDSFTYQVSDGIDTDTATVSITVSATATNDPPVATADSYATTEDSQLSVSAPGLLENDVDPDGDGLSVSTVTRPTDGVLTLNDDGGLVYVPANGFTGTDSFTYRVADGAGGTDTARVTVDVAPAEQPVAASDDSYRTEENDSVAVGDPGVLGDDTSGAGESLSAALVSATTNGSLTLFADGSFAYEPDSGFSGTDSFSYRATDGTGASDTATVTIRVDPVETNDPPVAGPDTYGLGGDDTLSVSAPGVLANDVDPDGDSLSAALITPPSDGTLTLLADGSFEYSPGPGFDGRDSFTYRVTDGAGARATGVVTIRDETASGFEIRSLTLANATARATEELTVSRGGPVTVTATVGNGGSEPARRAATLLVDGRVLDEEPLGLFPGESTTVSFTDLDTTALAAGVHTVTVDVAGERRSAALTVVPAAGRRHESGVPTSVFGAVAAPDGVLDREDVLGMVGDYVNGQPTNGVTLTRGQVLALVSYYITER